MIELRNDFLEFGLKKQLQLWVLHFPLEAACCFRIWSVTCAEVSRAKTQAWEGGEHSCQGKLWFHSEISSFFFLIIFSMCTWNCHTSVVAPRSACMLSWNAPGRSYFWIQWFASEKIGPRMTSLGDFRSEVGELKTVDTPIELGKRTCSKICMEFCRLVISCDFSFSPVDNNPCSFC